MALTDMPTFSLWSVSRISYKTIDNYGLTGYHNCGTYTSITVYDKTAFLAICLTQTLLPIFAANKKNYDISLNMKKKKEEAF